MCIHLFCQNISFRIWHRGYSRRRWQHEWASRFCDIICVCCLRLVESSFVHPIMYLIKVPAFVKRVEVRPSFFSKLDPVVGHKSKVGSAHEILPEHLNAVIFNSSALGQKMPRNTTDCKSKTRSNVLPAKWMTHQNVLECALHSNSPDLALYSSRYKGMSPFAAYSNNVVDGRLQSPPSIRLLRRVRSPYKLILSFLGIL